MRKVVCLAGDGIGPEVVGSMKRVLAALDAGIEWVDMPAGLSALETHGEPLPRATLDAIREYGVAIKGPTTTPGGGGHKSVNVELRQELDLFSGVRPIQSLPIPGTVPDLDFVFFRENTEGLYANSETISGEPGRRRVVLTAHFSEEAFARTTRAGCAYGVAHGLHRVTLVTKENILKLSGRLYHDAFDAVLVDFPNLRNDHLLVDAANMQLNTNARAFGVIVTENMFGDILSDGGAGLIGGLGVAPGANCGDRIALFEAVHGSAPDIAGQGKANPTALLLSGAMLLEHLGLTHQAERLRMSVDYVYREGRVITGDLARRYNIDPSGTAAFTDAVIANL